MSLSGAPLSSTPLSADAGASAPVVVALAGSHEAAWTILHWLDGAHEAAWTRLLSSTHAAGWTVWQEMAAEHDAAWTVWPAHRLESAHEADWTIRLEGGHEVAWTVWQALAGAHEAAWTVAALTTLEGAHEAAWTVAAWAALEGMHEAAWTVRLSNSLAADHATAWTVRPRLEGGHEAAWTLFSPLDAAHAAAWTVVDPTLLEGQHAAAWTIRDLTAIVSVPSHFLRVGAELIPFKTASLRADEGSAYWQCETLELQRASDYRKLPRDTPFTLNLFGVDYAFVVDTRELTRSVDTDGNPSRVATITGLSPGCRLAGPRATALTRTWTEPASARAIVEELLGEPVAWSMVDWWIPGNRLAANGAYPLDIARQVVEAAGGLLESAPDGSWIARPAWPVSVPDLLPERVADHELDDRTVFEVSERPSLEDRVNRVRIVDVEASYQDSLEWVAATDDPLRGEVRAFPSPWRDGLSIRHTRGTPPVYLDGVLTAATAEQTETVEFQAGIATVQYPVLAVLSVTWLAESLGGVAAAGTQLTATVAEYSLAEVVYTTRYLRAPAHASEPAQAQFLLEDAWLG